MASTGAFGLLQPTDVIGHDVSSIVPDDVVRQTSSAPDTEAPADFVSLLTDSQALWTAEVVTHAGGSVLMVLPIVSLPRGGACLRAPVGGASLDLTTFEPTVSERNVWPESSGRTTTRSAGSSPDDSCTGGAYGDGA